MPKAITPTANTATGTILPQGLIYKNWNTATERELGATSEDGCEFGVEREWRHQNYSGMRGKTKGNEIKKRVDCYLKIPLLELSNANLKDVNQGITSTDNTTHYTLREDFDVSDDDYWENIAWVGVRNDGKYCAYVVENPLNMENFIQALKDGQDVIQNCKFDGHYLKTATDTIPYYIELEK